MVKAILPIVVMEKLEAHFTLLQDRSEYGRNDIQTLN